MRVAECLTTSSGVEKVSQQRSSAPSRKENVDSNLLQKTGRRLLPVTQSSLTSNIWEKMKFEIFCFLKEGHIKID